MQKIPINFFYEGVRFVLKNKSLISKWLLSAILKENHKLNHLNFIFCNTAYIYTLNVNYLAHRTDTDVITFNNSSEEKHLEGDIFISYPQVKENAGVYKTSIQDELHRVMIHGVLHLLGYNDKRKEQKNIMKKKEDFYLSLRGFD